MTAEQARRHPTGETGVVPSELLSVTMALYVDSQGVSHPSSLLSTGACAFETTRYSTCSWLISTATRACRRWHTRCINSSPQALVLLRLAHSAPFDVLLVFLLLDGRFGTNRTKHRYEIFASCLYRLPDLTYRTSVECR
ncbi:hypothetical protein L227DRAFT_582134 [Lentinus tigrinus ALCF2SS1-6]|uniref:Uncharacterized protein n=1 Tax=Lentinus tigrinus ALCF2SS1-6 TaxID=1328759 RepID=A0A5C2RP37_9APHY|nr:hypothetical protein L227DRAFT_582134 [Lentinus tigrinus ALCF2SS1-6]